MGYLTGKIDTNTKFDPKVDLRAGFDRFSPANKNATPAQVALAWVMARKPFIVPIPGTRNMDHLGENLRAIDVQLTPADVSELETEFAKLTVHGGRMNEMQMQAVERAG
jgi:aryl-alcohol dehydrogenase-like predicted oxidoreductase